MILAGTERAYRNKVICKLSAVYLRSSDYNDRRKLNLAWEHSITVECRQILVNSKIFKLSLNLSLVPFRAHIVCYEQKKILRYTTEKFTCRLPNFNMLFQFLQERMSCLILSWFLPTLFFQSELFWCHRKLIT